jgi:hypothetical protein
MLFFPFLICLGLEAISSYLKMSEDVIGSAQAAIWGVCVADALGGPVQFKDPGTFKPITCLRKVAKASVIDPSSE